MACTGPTTEAGKAISSRNALKSGATSRAAVLPGEDQTRYDALVADTFARWEPQGDTEVELAHLVANTFWRHLRLLRIEAEFMASADQDGDRPDLAVANLFGTEEGASKLRLMLRYLASASREYRAAVAELRRVQAERMESEAEPDLPDFPEPRNSVTRQADPVPPDALQEPLTASFPELSRAERNALERAQRKADKKARQASWANGNAPAEFVSYSLGEAA